MRRINVVEQLAQANTETLRRYRDRVDELEGEQNRVNELVSDAFQSGAAAIDEVGRETAFLKKMIGCLVFATAGLSMGVLTLRKQLKTLATDIAKSRMNEG